LPDERRRLRKKWTLRKVVIEQKRDLIHEEIGSLLGDKDFQPGSNEYLGVYAKAVNQVIKGLSKQERKKYEALAEEWTRESLPKEIQIKYVSFFKINCRVKTYYQS
jgi:hypothetical protein